MWWWYFGAAVLTQVLAVVAELRKGSPWSEAWWWLIIWPLGLMWPLVVFDLIGEIIDGPYRPKHRVHWN